MNRRVDRFELLRELGRGGGGVVYHARDERLGEVAVKVLTTRLDGGRFERERTMLQELSGAVGSCPSSRRGRPGRSRGWRCRSSPVGRCASA